MGFLDDLKFLAGAAVAQVNPWDDDQTWDTRARGVKPGTPSHINAQNADQYKPPKQVETPPPNQRNQNQDLELKGYSLGEGKNKTILGWNAAAILPKSLEKVYSVNTDRDINMGRDAFLTEFDSINDEFKNKYVQDLRALAEQNDQRAINTINLLQESGRFKGDFDDFITGANERFLGGLARGAARTTDWVLPGVNTFGLEQQADAMERPDQFTQAGRRGENTGTALKGATDIAMTAIPTNVGEKALRGTQLFQHLAKGGKLARYGGNVAANVLPDLAIGTPIQSLISRGRGEDFDVKGDIAASIAIGAGTPLVGGALKAGGRVFKNAVGGVDEASQVLNAVNKVQEVDNHIRLLNQHREALVSRGLKETDTAVKQNAEAVTNALKVKNNLIKQNEALIKRADDAISEADKLAGRTARPSLFKDEGGFVRLGDDQKDEIKKLIEGSQKAIDEADAAINEAKRLEAEVDGLAPGKIKNPFTGEVIDTPPPGQGGYARLSNSPLDDAASGKTPKFTKTVAGSGELSDELRKAAGGSSAVYTPVTNQAQKEAAEKLVKKGYKKATSDVLERMNAKLGSIADQDVADAIEVIRVLDEKGGTANIQQATDVIDKLAEHLSRKGQALQAASLLNMRTPQGLKYSAQKALKKAGVEVTPEVQKVIDDNVKIIKNLPVGSAERDYAIKVMQKQVGDYIPSDLTDKLVGTWKAGLLTGVRTQTGNIVSNTTFRGMHEASRPGAVALDKFMSLFTGQRTTTLNPRGSLSGLGEGLSRAKKYLKTGVDELGEFGNKFDKPRGLKFKNPALDKYVNGVFNLMGAADKPFRYSQLKSSLYDMGSAAAKNQGLKGKAAREFVEAFVTDPPPDILEKATLEAAESVLASDTFLGNLASSARAAANNLENPAARAAAKGTVNVLAPFTGVPSAFVSRVIDFTPAGAVKEAVSQIAKGSLDQRTLANAISEATTGTAVVFLGMKLAENGLLTGDYPDDPKEQQRWEAEGIQSNAIKVGDRYYTLNYFGPMGALFGMGKRVNDVKDEGGGAGSQVASAGAGIARDTLDQSFLQGVQGALDAVNDPTRYAESFIKNQGSSVVPTLIKDVAEATDPKQRQKDDLIDAIQGKIPGLSQQLPARTDVFGNELGRKTGPGVRGGVETMTNPLRPSMERQTPVTREVDALKEQTGTDIFPTQPNRTVTIDGEKIKLSDQQRYDLNNTMGQRLQKTWAEAIQTDAYKNLSPDQKADMLSDLKKDVTAVIKREWAAKNNVGQYNPSGEFEGSKLTRNQTMLLNGDLRLDDYAKRSQASAQGYTITELPDNISDEARSTYELFDPMTSEERERHYYDEPDAEYRYLKAEHERKKLNGDYSQASQIRAEKSLAKAEIGSKFDKSIRDLYSLSKEQIRSVLEKAPNGKELAQQLLAYDQALYNNDLVSYAKFKYGFESRGSGGGRRRATFRPPSGGGGVNVESTYNALAALLRGAEVG